MNSFKKYFQCKNFEGYLSNPVSFKEGLELLFTHKPGDQFLYQVFNGKLRKIKRNHENRFVQTIARRIEDSIYFLDVQTFLNWVPETIENGFYLEAEILFEKPITIGKAIDLMMSDKFVKLKNPETGSTKLLKLFKSEDRYCWKSTGRFYETVEYGSLSLHKLLGSEFFEIIKING